MKVRPAAASLVLFLALAACADAPVDPGAGAGIDHSTARDRRARPGRVRRRIHSDRMDVHQRPVLRRSTATARSCSPARRSSSIRVPRCPRSPAGRSTSPASRRSSRKPSMRSRRSPPDLNDLGFMSIADASTTVITVSAGGVDRTIRVYALAEVTDRPEGMPEPEYRARVRLAELVTKLGSLESWLPEGSLGPEAGYEAAAARLFVGSYREGRRPRPGAGPLAARGAPGPLRRPRRARRRLSVRGRRRRGLDRRARGCLPSERAQPLDGCRDEVLDPVPTSPARRERLLARGLTPSRRLNRRSSPRRLRADDSMRSQPPSRLRCADP